LAGNGCKEKRKIKKAWEEKEIHPWGRKAKFD